MACEWSHTDEGIENVRRNLEQKDTEWLETVYAEWHGKSEDDYLNEDDYEAALNNARKIPEFILIDFIWERMSEQRTCTNGGHHAWGCPFGCHLVSFSEE